MSIAECHHGTKPTTAGLDCERCDYEIRSETSRRDRVVEIAATLLPAFARREGTSAHDDIHTAFAMAEDFEKRATAYRESGK